MAQGWSMFVSMSFRGSETTEESRKLYVSWILHYVQDDKYEASEFLAFARNDGDTQDFHLAQLDKLRSE